MPSLDFTGHPISISVFLGTGLQEVWFQASKSALSSDAIGKIWNSLDIRGQCVIPDALVPAVLTWKLDDAALTIRLSLDTRELRSGHFVPPERPKSFAVHLPGKILNSTGLHLADISLVKRSHVTSNCAVVMDLGNTRSFALLLDRVDQPGQTSLRFEPLNMQSFRFAAGPSPNVSTGAFDSVATLESPLASSRARATPSQQGAFSPLSFVRLGTEADNIFRYLVGDLTVAGNFMVSSPKRYFWQRDVESAGWKASNEQAALPKVVPLQGILPQALAGEAALSRANVLMATLIEVYEQAERQLNSWDYLRHQPDREHPRRIIHLCLLHPASWSASQVRQYHSTIVEGFHVYCNLRALPVPRVDLNCDESSAAMIPFIWGEIHKFAGSARTWIRSIGRRGLVPQLPPRARIGILDIGGGTSDLVIADVVSSHTGQQDGSFSIVKIYQDGFGFAGDEFLRKVIEEVLLPEIARIVSNTPKRVGLARAFISALLGDQGLSEMPGISDQRMVWARKLWFPLAVQVILAFERGEKEFRLSGLSGYISGQWHLFLDKLFELARMRQEELSSQEDIDKRAIAIPPSLLAQTAKSLFNPAARTFGAVVSAYSCDLILFAGKASEMDCIRNTFQRQIPLPPDAFVHLKNYPIGNWCSIAKDGRIADAKVTTVLGAALYTLIEFKNTGMVGRMAVELASAPDIGEDQHHYGIIQTRSNLKFDNRDAILSPEKRRSEALDLSHGPMLISRRKTRIEQQDAEIAYELRLRPDFYRLHRSTIRQPWVVLQGPNLHIADFGGYYLQDTPLTLAHFELRPRTLLEDDFWLDSGRILTERWHSEASE